jgi:hypothetical protein
MKKQIGVIDWSRWNDRPWWIKNGFKTREEAWDAYRGNPEASESAAHQAEWIRKRRQSKS